MGNRLRVFLTREQDKTLFNLRTAAGNWRRFTQILYSDDGD